MISPAASHSFSSQCRLHTAGDFSAVFAARRVLRGAHFDLHVRLHAVVDAAEPEAGSPRQETRLGLVIAKKFARRAVLRNLLKRIGRESFRQARVGLPACDLVLRLAKPMPGADATGQSARRVWRAEVDGLLARLQSRTTR